MNSIQITSVSTFSPPYSVYVCNVFGNYCILVATINNIVPPSLSIILPPEFETAPVVGVKIITCDGCEHFEIVYCVSKLFQDYDEFYFMDNLVYEFQS